MKVYILIIEYHYEGSEIIDVFYKENDANIECEKLRKSDKYKNDKSISFEVFEYEVK